MHEELNAHLDALEERIGTTFSDRRLLREAITHRSHLNECDVCTTHNERLEFLGDAVLEIIVTEHLFRSHPSAEEGALTNLRVALVNARALANVGHRLDLDPILLLAKGERRSGSASKSRRYILANAVEAVLGALYLDRGMGACRLFVDSYIHAHRSDLTAAFEHSKSDLQERTQEALGITPTYKAVGSWGPDHNRTFRVAVKLGSRPVAYAVGTSKQEAQELAARRALETQAHWAPTLADCARTRTPRRGTKRATERKGGRKT